MKLKQKIVLIEDDVYIGEMYMTKLELSGYEVVLERNGAKAVKTIKKEKPDLILLDILLPNKDGFEILGDIKNSQDDKIKSIPVFVISNLSTEEDVNEAKKLGALDFFVKAKIDVNELADRINKYFNSADKS